MFGAVVQQRAIPRSEGCLFLHLRLPLQSDDFSEAIGRTTHGPGTPLVNIPKTGFGR